MTHENPTLEERIEKRRTQMWAYKEDAAVYADVLDALREKDAEIARLQRIGDTLRLRQDDLLREIGQLKAELVMKTRRAAMTRALAEPRGGEKG